MTYDEIVADFKPQFGNANHITAVPLIDKARKLQKRLDEHNERSKTQKHPKKPYAIIKELDQLEKRIMALIRPDAPSVPYTGGDLSTQ